MGRRRVCGALLAGLLALPGAAPAAAQEAGAPADVSAVAGYDGIGLSWMPPAAAQGVPPVTEYRVYRDGGTEPVATVAETSSLLHRSYVDLVPAGSTHTYTVAAVAGDAGEGARSASVGATVPTVVSEQAGTVSGLGIEYGDGSDAGYSDVEGHAGWTTGEALLVYSDRLYAIHLMPVSGSAWAPGTIRARYTGRGGCAGVADFTLHEARVRADGTPEVLALSGDTGCAGKAAHVEIRYRAQLPLVAPETSPDSYTAVARPGETLSSTVFVRNAGSVDLVLGTASVPDGWTVTDDGCSGTTLAPGAPDCLVEVTFAPAALGEYPGTFVLPDNTPAGKRQVRLSGSAVDTPSAVRDLTVTAYVGRTEVRFEPPETAYPALTGYVVYRSLAGGPQTEVAELGTATTSFEETVGRPGQGVHYEVRARNARGEGDGATAAAVLPGRELVYSAGPANGTRHLVARPVPGTAAGRITGTPQHEEDPAYSLDGTRIAYTRRIGDVMHVYRSNADGSAGGRVAGNSSTGAAWTYSHPQWSPDGTRLAYACRPLTQAYYDLCVRSLVTGGTKVLPGVGEGGGSWLPNGTELVVVAATSPSELQVVAADGSYRRTIAGTQEARQVAVSPDGSRVAWTRYEGDDVGGETGTRPRVSVRVSPLSGGAGVALGGTGQANDPSWSVDGETVYWTHRPHLSNATPELRDVYSANARGTGTPVRLTDTVDVDEDDVVLHDVVSIPPLVNVPRPLADFTGDGRAEIAVFRPGNGGWYVRGHPTVYWGRAGDVPVAADYTGDGKAERAVFRPTTGVWYLHGRPSVAFGLPGDVPVPADYDGDGRAELAVFRPSNGAWYVRGRAAVTYGRRGDVPVPADYTGDGRADLAVYRPSAGTWSLRGRPAVKFSGKPAPADYLGRGRAQIAVLNGDRWHTHDVGPIAVVPGGANDLVAYGNVTGDRRAEPGVFNPATGTWRMAGQAPVTYGIAGDVPV